MEKTYPGLRDIVRESYLKRDIPIETIEIMIKSLSNNTINQYNVALKRWYSFCIGNNVDYLNSSVTMILKFLTDEFHKGASFGTLNSFRSALNLIISKDQTENDYVSRFFKGVFKIKPNFPKYHTTWNPNLVLDHLSKLYPNEELPLKDISKKLVTLLALSTGQRMQTLSLIKVKDIKVTDTCIMIAINEIIKTSAPNRQNPRLIIPFFIDKQSICPATTLISYMEKTKPFRTTENDNLIQTYKKPIHNCTAQSISRWIKETLSDSGVDVKMFSAYSTRHASTSAANRAGVSIEIIKKTAGWTGNSICFAKFYNQPLVTSVEETRFAEAVFNS